MWNLKAPRPDFVGHVLGIGFGNGSDCQSVECLLVKSTARSDPQIVENDKVAAGTGNGEDISANE